MKKNPNLIQRIEIKYFRSIMSERLKECSPLNAITGPNDVGKSNVLRALNLFFNNKNTEGLEPVFQEEFSHSRLNQVRQESVKGKQFIQISIDFDCSGAFQKTLPKRFRVTKTWYRDNPIPKTTHNIDPFIDSGKLKTTKNKMEGSLSRFLNSIVYTYVPAIKDQGTFRSIFSNLREVLVSQSQVAGSSFNQGIEKFNFDLERQAQELRTEFLEHTGVDAKIALPSTYEDLFEIFDVATTGAYSETVPLDSRGDGIRMRFLPAILNYVAERSTKLHIWGFEEPENSMEYKRAFELKSTMSNSYCKNAQIFFTTHSPAFIDLDDEGLMIYMASKNGADTEFEEITKATRKNLKHDDPMVFLADELGHLQLMDELHEKLETRIKAAEAAQETQKILDEELKDLRRPVLMTEGSTDVSILSYAWAALRKSDPPFAIKSCDVLGEIDNSEAAGAGQLAGYIKSVMPDSPCLVIGLFDHDDEGLKQFELTKNFYKDDLFANAKIARNRRAAAFTLPVPDGMEQYAKVKNLPIEFLFPLAALQKKVHGRGLELAPKVIVERVEGVEISKREATDPWLMKISDGKKHFSERVVPTLDADSFQHFELLFQVVEKLINDLS